MTVLDGVSGRSLQMAPDGQIPTESMQGLGGIFWTTEKCWGLREKVWA